MTVEQRIPSTQPPPLPNAAVCDAAPVSAADAVDSSESGRSLRQLLLGVAASGYYLSLVLHAVIYTISAIAFIYFADQSFEDEDNVTIAVRASLSENELADAQPEFEVTQDLGLATPKGPTQAEQLSNYLKVVQNGTISTNQVELQTMASAESDDPADDSGGDFLFKLPKSGLAVTKGSFTAWTDPENPSPGERYNIIIVIKLPDTVKAYRVSDLTGSVIGSDGFRQRIPYDSARMSASFYTDEKNQLQAITGREAITVRNNQIQLVISIPGAERLTRDVIKISSKRLREKQELELIFGGPRNREE